MLAAATKDASPLLFRQSFQMELDWVRLPVVVG